jgi:hypothetical protein
MWHRHTLWIGFREDRALFIGGLNLFLPLLSYCLKFALLLGHRVAVGSLFLSQFVVEDAVVVGVFLRDTLEIMNRVPLFVFGIHFIQKLFLKLVHNCQFVRDALSEIRIILFIAAQFPFHTLARCRSFCRVSGNNDRRQDRETKSEREERSAHGEIVAER